MVDGCIIWALRTHAVKDSLHRLQARGEGVMHLPHRRQNPRRRQPPPEARHHCVYDVARRLQQRGGAIELRTGAHNRLRSVAAQGGRLWAGLGWRMHGRHALGRCVWALVPWGAAEEVG